MTKVEPDKVYQSILVGIDFSPGCAAALRVAGDLARKTDAVLRPVHYIHAEIAEKHRREWREGLSEIVRLANRDLDAFVEQTLGSTDGIDLHTDAHLGHSLIEMFQAIDEYSVDLLVLGAHGRHHPDQKAPGILPTRCVRKAPCEVLLVHRDADVPFRSILAAIDYSANAALAAVEAHQIGQLAGADTHMVHISPPPWQFLVNNGLQSVSVSDEAKNEYRIRQEDRMTAFIKGLDLEQSVRHTVREDPEVVKGLIECQKEWASDLIVLGNRGQTPETFDPLGSFAERIIQAAPCSVLAVKPRKRQ